MESEKILKLFKKFIGGELNLHGLIAEPIKAEKSIDNSSTNIYFKILNPNDVSYFSPLVEDRILDETGEFGDLININIDVYFVPDFKTGVHLNKELKSKIQKVFNSVRVIEFTDINNDDGYMLFIEPLGITTATWDNDSFYILNDVKVRRAEKNGEWWDPEVVRRIYVDEFLPEMETYWETEELYGPIDEILNEYPLLTDPYGNISSYYDTKFVYKTI